MTVFDRFRAKYIINPVTGCWEWLGHKVRDGYGAFRFNGKDRRAHRVSFMLFKGEVPDDIDVLHTCDNSGCVNPEHLFLGDHSTNMKDMYAKARRHNKGTSNPNVQLAEEDIINIRASTLSGKELATLYDVSPTNIRHIRKRKTWRHI